MKKEEGSISKQYASTHSLLCTHITLSHEHSNAALSELHQCPLGLWLHTREATRGNESRYTNVKIELAIHWLCFTLVFRPMTIGCTVRDHQGSVCSDTVHESCNSIN